MNNKTASELSLESRGLRAVLRVEVVSARPPFFDESPLCDLLKSAEECLPAALASVAPQMLRQIVQEVEARLVQSSIESLSSGIPDGVFNTQKSSTEA